MTEQDAIDLAEKRNKHKGKHLTHKTWRAREVDGEWKAVFEDTVSQSAATAANPSMTQMAAMVAVGQAILDNLDPETRAAFQAMAHENLMARIRRTLGEE